MENRDFFSLLASIEKVFYQICQHFDGRRKCGETRFIVFNILHNTHIDILREKPLQETPSSICWSFLYGSLLYPHPQPPFQIKGASANIPA